MSRRPPDIEVHIEELVLHGFEGVQLDGLRDALTREVARRLATSGSIEHFLGGTQLAGVRAQDVLLRRGAGADEIGTEVGRTLYEVLRTPSAPASDVRPGGGRPVRS